jgi:diacylglycerol kinase family enzyme
MNTVKTIFVVNPVSNNGRTRKNWQKTALALHSRGYEFRVHIDSRTFGCHGYNTAQALQQGYELVVEGGG